MRAKMTKVETIVPDSAVNQIVDDISSDLNPGKKELHGMIFIKDVSDAYKIETKQMREAVLSSK
jgi:nitrogen regulatory protein PII